MPDEKEVTNQNSVPTLTKNSRKNQKAWRVIAIGAIVALVGLLIFGLVMWNNYQKQVDELQTQIDSQQNKVGPQSNTSGDQTISEASTVVVKIPEAGIQFLVPNGYPTITYKSNNDGSYAIVASDNINPNSMCQAADGSVGVLVGNTRERLESLGDDPDSGNFGTLVAGKYWTVATGGVCDNGNPNNKVNQLLDYIKSHINAL